MQTHPATLAAYLRVSDSRLQDFGLPETIEIVSASPELFLRRLGHQIFSSPIKGTAATAGDFLEKDISENVMIVDLVRNDLSIVCEVASVHVPQFLERHEIPGISHLVTTVAGTLRKDSSWKDIFSATFPPGSVTGAPKSSALEIISEIETERNIYCGTLGIVDADLRTAELSVAIRTFWRSGNQIKFGTGAGITWGSEPESEWLETELKAERLIKIASKAVN
jgi:para-aminobenzoate synthetase component 1